MGVIWKYFAFSGGSYQECMQSDCPAARNMIRALFYLLSAVQPGSLHVCSLYSRDCVGTEGSTSTEGV